MDWLVGILFALIIFPGGLLIGYAVNVASELIGKLNRPKKPNIYQMEFAARDRKAEMMSRIRNASRQYDSRR